MPDDPHSLILIATMPIALIMVYVMFALSDTGSRWSAVLITLAIIVITALLV